MNATVVVSVVFNKLSRCLNVVTEDVDNLVQ